MSPNAELLAVPTGKTIALDPIEFTRAGADRMEVELLKRPQLRIPLIERFAPGVYMREVEMPIDSFIIGHRHRTKHFNVVIRGKASVLMDGKVHHFQAGDTFVSDEGVRKILYIHETCVWQTVHPTEETDPAKLEEMLIIKSDAFQEHQAEIERQQLAYALNNSATMS